MTPERWRQVEAVYHAALEREPSRRAAFLYDTCQKDEELRREVESLLAQGGSLLEHPAWEARELKPGAPLGPYQIVASIGAGGMGDVYRARDTRLNRDVAIKVSGERFSSRFEREARAVAALNHPNICTIHDVGPNYLVMELVEGPTLADRIKQGALQLDEALRIARQIADALEAAHEKGIVHRDLKPANIKIKPDGKVKVLDFGLATQSGEGEAEETTATMTAPGTILGTAPYMSPEQARGKPVDKRTDVWAFGAVLYEMLTGQQPFKGETVTDVLAAVVNTEPDWNKVPAKVQRLLRRCLEKDPEQRLRHIVDFELLLADTGPARRRDNRLPWAGAAALLAIIAAGAWWVWRATRPVDRPLRPLMRLDLDLGPQAVASQFTATAITPDGTRLVFPARSPDGKAMLAIRSLDDSKPTLLPGTENGKDPFFSPDGKWMGYFADGKMKKISLQGGTAAVLCDAPNPHGASWADDGSIFAALERGGAIERVPAAGGAPQTITKLKGGELSHRWPQVLPGSDAILLTTSPYTVAIENSSIAVMSLKSQQTKILVRGAYFSHYLPSGDGTGHLVYIHEGVLFGAAFDPARLELRSAPVPLLGDLAGDPDSGAGQLSFSRTGILVYRTGKTSTQRWPLWWLAGSGKTQPLIATPRYSVAPRFSPDGRQVALVRIASQDSGVFVYDWQRDNMSRLVADTDTEKNTEPTWSRDGKHILYSFRSASEWGFRWIRADGSGETQSLLTSGNQLIPMIPYTFFPDGRRLTYDQSNPGTGSDLWTVALDISDPDRPKPGKPELFLRTPNNERYPAASPDGRWIAYQSDESGRWEIYVRPFPGPGGKWQVSNTGGQFPVWSPTAHELFFQTLDSRIMVTEYQTAGSSFIPGRPRKWSDQPLHEFGGFLNYDLAPDGRRFVVIPELNAAAEEKGDVHVTFLLNFFDELRRKAPVSGK
jgi:hypothetical protein